MVDIDSLEGKTIGRQYELRRLVGSGGMGAVYRGVQLNLQRDVAIKVLYNRLSNDAEYLERFNREALIAASLEHPHIVPVYDYGTEDEINYVVMRLLTGGSLEERFGHNRTVQRPLPSIGEIMTVLRQLAGALDYAHSQGVVHRDIKDSNVMFDRHGSAFLVDFGIARLTEVTSQLTGTGMTLGTPSYMSPEQWRGERAYPASDQYSMGVMAFALLTGELPFEAPNPHALMYKHLTEPPPNPHDIRPELGTQVNAVFQRVLAKDLNDRYEMVTSFVDALEVTLPSPTDAGQLHQHTGFFTTEIPAAEGHKPTPVSRRAPAPADPSIPTVSVNTTGQPMDDPPPAAAVAGQHGDRTRSSGGPRTGATVTAVIAVALVVIFAGVLLMSYAQSRQTPPTGLLVAFGMVQAETATPPPPTATEPASAITPTGVRATLTPTTPARPTDTARPRATATASNAQITAERPNVVVRSAPDQEAAILLQLEADQTANITGVSEDGEWYQIETADGIGWVLVSPSISTAGNLREIPVALAPSATPPPTETHTPRPSPTPTNTLPPSAQPTWTPLPITAQPGRATAVSDLTLQNCPRALPSRLVSGERGYVLENDPRPINIRSAPGTNAEIVGTVPIRSTFDVLDGPSCADDIAWYDIDYNGTRGWIAEGTEVYFVMPFNEATAIPSRTSDQQVMRAVSNLAACDSALVLEDFEGETTTEWFSYDQSARYTIGIQDGAYQINMVSIPPQGSADPVSWGSLQQFRFADARVDAVVRASQFAARPTARTGLWLRYQNEENFLAFMISSPGSYRIARFEDGYSDLVPWTRTDAINIGDNAVNTLTVEIQDESYTFFINGMLMDTVTDGTWRDGRLAFMGSTTDQPATFALEHIRICEN